MIVIDDLSIFFLALAFSSSRQQCPKVAMFAKRLRNTNAVFTGKVNGVVARLITALTRGNRVSNFCF